MYDCKVKTFVPCIFLKDGRAVMGEESGKEVSQDPAHLAAVYADEMADAVLVVDCSEKEEEHEEMISCLRSICSSVQIPVLCAGNIRSLSDVKDIIYAGCGMAVLDFSKKDNVAIAKEAAEKLGKERIAAGCREPHEITENEDLIASSVSLLVLLEEKDQAACLAAAGIPCLGAVPDLEEETILSYFAEPNAAGVTGKAVNAGMERIRSLRHLLLEHDYKVNARRPVFSWEELKKDPQGLVPVVVQEAYTDQVLMVAYMDENAYSKTIETGKMTSRGAGRRSGSRGRRAATSSMSGLSRSTVIWTRSLQGSTRWGPPATRGTTAAFSTRTLCRTGWSAGTPKGSWRATTQRSSREEPIQSRGATRTTCLTTGSTGCLPSSAGRTRSSSWRPRGKRRTARSMRSRTTSTT